MGFKDYKTYSVGTPLEEFEKGLNELAEGTATRYRKKLDDFLDYNNSTHQELFDWVRELEASDDPRNRRQLSNAFYDFAKNLTEQGFGGSTIHGYKNAVHKFLEANELNIRIRKSGKKIVHHGSRIIQLDQVRTLVDLAATNLRLRALIMALKDTGLGVSEIAMLTCDDFLGAREYKDEDGNRFKAWAKALERAKTGEACEVHMGPDAIKAIEDYIGTRKTGSIFLIVKGAPHKDENGVSTRDAGYTNVGDPMKPIGMSSTIGNHTKVLRMKGFKISAHSFRKLFETSFSLEGSLNVAKKIMGKAIPPSDAPYLQYEDELTKIYMKIYNRRLSLYKESTIVHDLKEQLARYVDRQDTLDQGLRVVAELEANLLGKKGIDSSRPSRLAQYQTHAD